MNPKVSIVVTCYNHEKYVEACLRSIFGQTYKNIELLVYNDGSSDDSEKVITSVLTESPFEETRYFSDKNQGLAFIKNKALRHITGEFLLFVDSDNFLDTDHVKKLLSALIEDNKDIAYCQLWDFLNQRNVLREDLEYSLEKELEGNLIDASSLVRVSVIKESTFDEALNNKALEDYDFWLSLIVNRQAQPIFVKETKLNYRVLEDSMSARGNWENYYQSYFYIMNKYIESSTSMVMKALKQNIFIWLNGYRDAQKKIDENNQIIADQQAMIEQQQAELSALSAVVQEKDNQILSITNSKSFKLARAMTYPVRKLRQ